MLETAGRQWAAERVKDIRSISNGITIGSEWDLASPDLVTYAVERGWRKGRDDFDFARCYSDPLYTRLSRCNERQCRTTDALAAQRGKITIETMLRDHGTDAQANWSPARGVTTFTVCAHAGFGPIRATLRDYATRIALYRDERDALERRWVADALDCRDKSLAERAAFSARRFEQAADAEARWLDRMEHGAVYPGLLYGIDRDAKITMRG